jgi:hypothetical protein
MKRFGIWMAALAILFAALPSQAATLTWELDAQPSHDYMGQPHVHDVYDVYWTRSDDGDWRLLHKEPGPPAYVYGGITLAYPTAYGQDNPYVGAQDWWGHCDLFRTTYELYGVSSFMQFKSSQFVFKYLTGTPPNEAWNYLTIGFQVQSCSYNLDTGWTAVRTWPSL